MGKFQFYHINEHYISYLHSIDTRVQYNKGQRRPYVGIVLSINGIDYYVPLESPKPNHVNIKGGVWQSANRPGRKKLHRDKPLPEHLIDCASALLTLLKVCVVAAVTDVRNRENRRLSGDNAAADFGFHCRQNSQSVKGTLNFKHDFVKHGWLSSPFSASMAQIGE